jgi:hypothetical protein
MWRIWWVPHNASRWQIGFNSAFKGLKTMSTVEWQHRKALLNTAKYKEWYIYIYMHTGMNKFKLLASQAHIINRYKNTRSKIQKCCANIYFNKQCLNKYIHIYILLCTPGWINSKRNDRFTVCCLKLMRFILNTLCAIKVAILCSVHLLY